MSDSYIGKKYGKLTILSCSTTEPGYVWCECDCGKTVLKYFEWIKSGRSTSCGCVQKEAASRVLGELKKVDRMLNTSFSRIECDKTKTKNKSGRVGVYVTKCGTYSAWISVNKRKIYLGTYKTKKEAVRVRELAEMAYHDPLINKKKELIEEGF